MAKDLKQVLIENGLELFPSSGNRWVAVCPFHEGDHDPSLTIYPNETYWCFGCQTWGDAAKFLVDYKGMTTFQAYEYLGEDYKQPKAEKAKIIKIKNVSVGWKFIYDVAHQYHINLMNSPGPISYLKRRGLTEETIKRYELGYTDGSVLKLFHSWEVQLAFELGIITKNNWEVLSHRIVIPNILEPERLADYMIGRTVVNDGHKYVGIRVPKPVHGFYEVRGSPILFIGEGQLDWLTLRQWGFPAISHSGTHITAANKLLLKDKIIVICPDYDETVGEKAADKLQTELGDNAYVLDYSALKEGIKTDVSSLAERKDGEQSFKEVVREQFSWLITPLLRDRLTKLYPGLVM